MITIWCVTDDKPGHKNQLKGLVNALAANTELRCEWLSINSKEQWPAIVSSPTQSPNLIIAAGSHTHVSALQLRYRYGGKLVVLMKPWLPRFLFDLCLIPHHDGVKESTRVVNTQGAINHVAISSQSDPARGLILIGGPSKHYGWSEESMIEQIATIKNRYPQISWTLTTSRRTPSTFIKALELDVEGESKITIVPVEQTDSSWLLAHYRDSGIIWVTEDSVSMVYESLSSGAKTGILSVPRLNDNRVSKGLDQLIDEGRVMALNDDRTISDHIPLCEAERAATIIRDRLL